MVIKPEPPKGQFLGEVLQKREPKDKSKKKDNPPDQMDITLTPVVDPPVQVTNSD